MTDIVKATYIFSHAICFIALLTAAIIKPEWLIGFIIIGILSGFSLSYRMDQWSK